MSDATMEVERRSGSALPVRIFGWLMLGLLAAFLISNVLNLSAGVPGLLSGSPITLFVYGIAVAICFFYVFRSKGTSLRQDADMIHRANIYFIRACFWAVFLIGIVDVSIAFMRTENLFDSFLAEDSIRAMGRARFVGTYVHLPLIVLSFIIAYFTRTLGFVWLALHGGLGALLVRSAFSLFIRLHPV